MEQGFTIQGALADVLGSLAAGAVAYAPRLVTATVLVLIGLAIAKIVAVVLGQVFYRARLNQLIERSGLRESLERVGIHDVSRRFLPGVVFWLAMLVFLQAAATMVGLDQIAAGIAGFFAFLPNLFSAVLILLLGSMLARFLARAVTEYARESGVGFARSLGSAISTFVLGVVAIIVLGQLQVDTRILNILTIVIFAGLSLGFALTFGLGTRDATRNMIAGFYARRIFTAGERIEISGARGVLRGITTTQTLLESEGAMLAVPNSAFFEQTVGRLSEAGDQEGEGAE